MTDAILRYRGAVMSDHVHAAGDSRRSIGWVYDRLYDFKHVQCALEPGDATRYDLVLVPISTGNEQRGLLVTRLRGGGFVATIVLWDWTEGASDYMLASSGRILGVGNDWSIELLTWWLTRLCTNAHAPAEGL